MVTYVCLPQTRLGISKAKKKSQFKTQPTKEKKLDIIRIICAVFLPPLGVFLQVGIGPQFWINILLTLLGYIPGIVHAIWIIARR